MNEDSISKELGKPLSVPKQWDFQDQRSVSQPTVMFRSQ
jgi:hypothetical protein